MSNMYYEIKAARQKDSADLFIYDAIGGDFFSEGVTAKQFLKDINALSVKTLNVFINSPGGSVFEALAIYNGLKSHSSHVVTHIDGLAASAASFIALAGDTVVMAENAMIMIHNPWSMTAGGAEDLRKEADVLDKLAANMADIYMTRYTGTVEELTAALDAETWYNADEALAAGFIDAIGEPMTAAASITSETFAGFNYKNAPIKAENSDTTEVADTPTETESETNVDNTVTPAETVETVEATQSAPQAAHPVYSVGQTRTPINSAAKYLEHKIRAAKGNEDSQSYIRIVDANIAKIKAAAADSTGNPALVHDSWLNEIITTSIGTTAAIDAVGVSPLMETGLSFKIPRVSVYPTAATTAEGATASETAMETADIDVSIIKKAGKQTITFELFDRSTPSFYNEVLRQIRVALDKNKDEYLLAQLIAGGTAATTTAGTIAGLQSFIATETSAALSGTGDFADQLLASPDWWTTIKAAKDTTGRSLYAAKMPMNAGGDVRVNSLRGDVEGMDLYVDPFLAAGSGLVDNSALIIGREAARYWESPIREVRINNLTDGAIEVEYYQYVAAKVVKSAGVRKFNLT